MADPTALLETVTDLVVDGVRDALDGTNPNLAPLVPPDGAAARADLAALVTRAAAVSDAADPVSWLQAIDQWRTTMNDLAIHAFGGGNAEEAMLVRIVQERLPRVAAFLTMVGVIVTPVQGQPSVDWTKLRQLVNDPGTLVNEDLWDALLGDAGLPGTGRLPAVIVGLLILFPQTLLALIRGDAPRGAARPPAHRRAGAVARLPHARARSGSPSRCRCRTSRSPTTSGCRARSSTSSPT